MYNITQTPIFGLLLTIIFYNLGRFIQRKTGNPIFNPLLIAIICIIAFLSITKIPYEAYKIGGDSINFFLSPVTVVLAVPLYKQLSLLKKNFIPIIIGITIGCLVSVLSIMALARLFNLNNELIISLLPKSVTTPIGIEISNTLGGITGVTVLAVVITGITGAIIAPIVCKVFRITDPVARGIGIGTASHAVGTSKALEMGETEGAMSSLSIGIAGLITVVIAPICLNIVSKFF